MFRTFFSALLSSFLFASMTLAAPPETDYLRNTPPASQSPSASPNSPDSPSGTAGSVRPAELGGSTSTTIVQPETVVVPGSVSGTAPGNVQIMPESNNTIVLPDTNVNQDISITQMPPANGTLPTPVVVPPTVGITPVPETKVIQPVPNQPVVVPEPKVIPSQPVVVPEPNVVPELKIPSQVQPSVKPPMTPADFLVKTPEEKQKPTSPPSLPKEPEKKPVPPAKTPPVPPTPPVKTPEQEPVKVAKSKKNDPLMIPEEAKKTGNMSFLEGCWKGTRPEYNTKRIITERFCFTDKGVGKRTINDPKGGRVCVGPALADMRKDGSLHIASEQAICLTGDEWGAAEMLCIGEGNSTPCSWEFPDINEPRARQSYKIRFVRD